MTLADNPIVGEILDSRSITNIDYYIDVALNNHCTVELHAFLADVRAQGNDLDRVHLVCAKVLGQADRVKELTDWIVAKDERKKK